MNVISQLIENRYRPLVALDAIRKLIRDKEDTSQVFRLLVALRGMSFVRNVKRFGKTPLGARVNASKIDLVDTLVDRAYLEGLPAGSLGREFIAFMDHCGITPEGLTAAAREAGLDEYELTEDERRYEMRVRVQHDCGMSSEVMAATVSVRFAMSHFPIRTPKISGSW